MISLDTNLLFFALASDRPENDRAVRFLESLAGRNDVVLSEFVLLELYRLLRNPVVASQPLSAPEAVHVIQHYRHHPQWRIVGFSDDSVALHTELWRRAAAPQFAYRRVYDLRLALSLRHQGVTAFATANTKDYQGFGFHRVWNPLTES